LNIGNESQLSAVNDNPDGRGYFYKQYIAEAGCVIMILDLIRQFMKKNNVVAASRNLSHKLKVLAKKKENVRLQLVVTAGGLRRKAQRLARTAKRKEGVRSKLAITAEALRLKAQQLAVTAQQLAVTAREKESIRRKLAVTDKELSLKGKSIEQAEAKEKAILASIDDGVVACDKAGLVVVFNRAAEALTGLSASAALGRPYGRVLKFIRESDGKPSDDFIRSAIKQGRATKMASHTMLVQKNGYKIAVADSTAPVRDPKGALIGCVVVFRDITQEKRIDKAKTEFVSLASHQLRTPLTTVNWYSEMLLAGDVGTLNKKQMEYLQEIYQGSKRMVALVNALLNVSRLELGTFAVNPEPTDIAALMRSVVDGLRPQIGQKNLKFTELSADHLPILQADPQLLRMVVQNILVNAIKYTPDKGSITLELALSDAQGRASQAAAGRSHVLIKVSDTGYGIPRSNQDKIFTKLFRADNVRAKDTEGTGLGLYIAKSIVDQSGGRIWFESQEDKGTIFYVTLPLAGMKKKTGTKTLA